MLINERTKIELSFMAEMFGFVFVILGALIAERIAARAIVAIVGAAAIFLARNWRDPHYWAVRLPTERNGWPYFPTAEEHALARPLNSDNFELEDSFVKQPEPPKANEPAYNRAPWMQSSKPDASKGTLK